jgi:hypothetical protein
MALLNPSAIGMRKLYKVSISALQLSTDNFFFMHGSQVSLHSFIKVFLPDE